MFARRTALIITESGRGYVWGELETDHKSVFIHHSEVDGHRVLHVGDRVELEVVPNPRRPACDCGVRVRYVGHITHELGGAR